MRIFVFSDSHGNYWVLKKIVERYRSQAAFFIHLGDLERDVESLRPLCPGVKILGVPGNCDMFSTSPSYDLVTAEGRQILFTHGHRFHVKNGLDSLKSFARANGADVALYGHTHVSHTEYDDGLYLMNPGSVSASRNGGNSFGIVDITPAGIVTNVVSL